MRNVRSLQPGAYRIRPSCRRGSIMILVIVLIVLLAVMGMAYVQIARVDRMATSQIKPNNVDVVVSAVVEQIKFVLKDDLVNKAGTILEPRTAGVTPVTKFERFTNGDEAYDYPWTNSDPAVNFPVSPQYAAATNARGGELDDMWLASSYLEKPDTGAIRWGHITNLNGIFLDLPLSTDDPTNTTIPRTPGDNNGQGEHVIDFTGTDVNRSDTNVAIVDLQASTHNQRFQPRGVDVDGDGIPDSRWTWAPIREIAGVNYVMAVRIIDNSSMLNVNTATALINGTGAFGTGTSAPVALWPTSADIARLLQQAPGGAGFSGAISKLAEHRLPGIANTEVLPALTGFTVSNATPVNRSQGYIYRNLTSLYGYPFVPPVGGQELYRFEWADELNLRFGNGVRSDRFGQTALEAALYTTGMGSHDFLRSQYNEGSFVHAGKNGPKVTWQLDNPQHMLAFFATDNDVRKWLTTYSGASVLRPNVDPTGGALPPFMESIDLSPQRVVNWTAAQRDATRTQLRDALARIFSIGSPRYLGLTTPAEVEALAAQFTANVFDYLDSDNDVTTVKDASANDHYGMERLPVLRQFYVQARYRGMGSAPESTETELWELINAPVFGFAVELGNPFDQDIGSIKDRLRLQIVGGTTIDVPLEVLGMGTPSLASDPTIPAGGSIVIYCNPNSGGSGSENALDDIGALVAGSDKVKLTPGPLFNNFHGLAGSATLSVRLQVDVDPGIGQTWRTIDELVIPGGLPSSPSYDGPPPAPPLGTERTLQLSAARPCEDAANNAGAYYLKGGSEALVLQRKLEDALPKAQPSDTHLGSNAKGVAGDPNLAKVMLRVPNRPIFNPAELAWICTVGFSDTTTFTQNVATMLSLPNPAQSGTDIPRGLFLDFSNHAEVPALPTGSPDNYPARYPGVPHAALVLGAISTLSPQNDMVDNDDDDGDGNLTTHADGDNTTANGPYELFVPGTINVNTAPPQLLELAVPLPETSDDLQAAFKALARYRDVAGMDEAAAGMRSGMLNRSDAKANVRIAPGIATLGEMMWLYTGVPTDVRNMQRYAFDAPGATPATVNLYPLPAETGTFATPPENDAEERMQRFQFLNQVLSTRSDVFTAYVEIRGYPSDDWRKGPVEQARFLAVFDRGRMKVDTGANPDLVEVRLIGLYRY